MKRILRPSQKFKGCRFMETENKSHELDKNRDKNPAGPSTLGGKAWPDDKYPNFFLRISYDNNNILFPWNQAQLLPLVIPELLKFFSPF